jgi:ubiquinone/menaquinone biosynthesis C-methylase UbiE
MQSAAPELAQIKSAMKASWSAGDFGQIARYSAQTAEDFIARTAIKQGTRVLDVACGTGNTAIPAAKTGAAVTGLDLVPSLLEQARQRAAAEKLNIVFQEGDAEELPFQDREFDLVITMFGAMFAPRPDRVAAELVRVCKSGGQIAMANWTPEGFVGKQFLAMSEIVPPPPGIPAPILWGDEKVVRQRLSKGISKLVTSRQKAHLNFPFAPNQVVAFFRQYFGPTQVAFSKLDGNRQAQLATRLEALWNEHNVSNNGNTSVEAEYLDVRATVA